MYVARPALGHVECISVQTRDLDAWWLQLQGCPAFSELPDGGLSLRPAVPGGLSVCPSQYRAAVVTDTTQ